MRLLNSCCGCISLKIGALIICLLGMVMGILEIILPLVTKIKYKLIFFPFIPTVGVKIILIINGIFDLIVSILFLIGMHRRRTLLMIPFLILYAFGALGILISIIVTSADKFKNNDTTIACLHLIFGLLGIGIFIYLWLVVFSYYEEMRKNRDVDSSITGSASKKMLPSKSRP